MSGRVERFIEEATNNAVDIEMTVVESTGTVRSLTENTTQIFVGEDDFPSDIKRELEYADEKYRAYHIKVATFRLDGDNEKITSWFGLGGGTYARVHFSKGSKASDFEETATSPHPEEVWLHEIIHCLESLFNDLGTMAGLHDNAKYGYDYDNGWYKWYHDILAGKVKDTSTGEFVGIKADMWQHLPERIKYWKEHTYKIFDIVRTWSGAKSYCEALGGHLVTITSEAEQNVVSSLLKQVATWNYFGYWMGAQRDVQDTTKWHWLTGEAFNYTKFSDGQPDGSGNYLQMYNYPDQGNWDDTTANANVEIQGGLYPRGIICEWEYEVTPPVTILTANHLPGGVVNATYSQSLVADEKTSMWTLISGTVPTGLTLSSSGLLNGIPTVTGSFDFTVKAQNNSEYDLKTFTLEVVSVSVPPVITTVTLNDANINEEYYQKLEANGSAATWRIIDGYLPTNLVLSQNGEITGRPLVAENYSFTVRAENTAGHNDKTFNLKVINTEMKEDDKQEEQNQSEDENQEYQNNQDNQNRDDNQQEEHDDYYNIPPQQHKSGGSRGGCNSSNAGVYMIALTFILTLRRKEK